MAALSASGSSMYWSGTKWRSSPYRIAASATSSAFTEGMWRAVSSGLSAPTSWGITAPSRSGSPKS